MTGFHNALPAWWAASCSWLGHVLGRIGRRMGAPPPRRLGAVTEYRACPLLRRLPFCPSGITFGNVIVYGTAPSGEGIPPESPTWRYDGTGRVVLRNHEFIHIRQYRAWGPFFLPAYLLAQAWTTGRRMLTRRPAVNRFEQHADDHCTRGLRRLN